MSADTAITNGSEVLDLLTAYQPLWSAIRERRERTLVTTKYGEVSGDPQLEYEWQIQNGHMDDLLEQYFTEQLGSVALDGIEHEQIISEHADLVAENGKGTN